MTNSSGICHSKERSTLSIDATESITDGKDMKGTRQQFSFQIGP